MWHGRLVASLIGAMVVGPATGRVDAAEFYVYRATASILLQSATFVNQVDRIVRVKLSSKKLINASLGQPLKGRPPANLVLAVATPKDAVSFDGSRLGILDTTGNTFTTIATANDLTILSPDGGGMSAGVGQASVGALPTGSIPGLDPGVELSLQPFTIAGGGVGQSAPGDSGPSLTLKIAGLHGLAFRQGDPGYYASAITQGTLRVSGKPVATVDL